ncbi:aminomethyl-transferring glycine dehydrogenase subunit GcvPB [Candidatus Bipolaricaulota bacterium]|nr:aminomethyl-transferring glycine dehydrogenase subunit GcvPB [Candidatus Bipolaricaulota bacterium]MBS3814748.1 aminomethyl-transferring glycine dehydrogenase subunit GcvPB [Candidatus Bipolaricaulota bacterium]MBS3825035.1 aminomethyl-transferring glycine dehydrogenase subunit GcvPB [Candidatus Bipolaricaulota bacterium]
MSTIFDKSKEGKYGTSFTEKTFSEMSPNDELDDELLRSEDPLLPQVSQPELVRHYTKLSKKNYGVDDGLYPLGSCTMKHNPKPMEDLAKNSRFQAHHPLVSEELVQGNLELMYDLGEDLKAISGMDGITLQPAAGAHGELTGMLIIRKYHEDNNELNRRREILLPDSSHGTNPASAAVAGFDAVEIKSNEEGTVDLEELKSAVSEETAGIMLTVPNTLGIFEKDITEVARIVHDAGGLCYFDGANLNAFLGRVRPGDMGMDITHFNLHKTFSTPHGGGGPGAGPVAVKENLVPYLPVPTVEKSEEGYELNYESSRTIGKVTSFPGPFGVMVKAYAYIRALGDKGLKKVSGNAVLNANYLKEELKNTYKVAYEGLCKHEFVLSGTDIGEGVKTVDIAKRLLDYGYHPPTVYFPLIVKEALMVEPTETETKEALDEFVQALLNIAEEAEKDPDLLHQAPTSTPVGRLDETKAAREPILRWREKEE